MIYLRASTLRRRTRILPMDSPLSPLPERFSGNLCPAVGPPAEPGLIIGTLSAAAPLGPRDWKPGSHDHQNGTFNASQVSCRLHGDRVPWIYYELHSSKATCRLVQQALQPTRRPIYEIRNEISNGLLRRISNSQPSFRVQTKARLLLSLTSPCPCFRPVAGLPSAFFSLIQCPPTCSAQWPCRFRACPSRTGLVDAFLCFPLESQATPHPSGMPSQSEPTGLRPQPGGSVAFSGLFHT